MASGIVNQHTRMKETRKIMKNKILSMLTITALTLSMAACGQNTSGTAAGDTSSTASGTAADSTSNTVSGTTAGDISNSAAGDASDTAASAGSAEDGELKEIIVVLDWYPNAVHAFMYVAMEKGYYEDEGLKVNIQFPANDNDALSLVAAGQSQIGIFYQQDIITTRTNQDVPVKSIGAITQEPLNIILSLADKNITEPKDLEGKTIGYAGTDLSAALVRYVMEQAGVTYDENKLINVGFDLMSSMTTGNVDATIGCMVNHEVPQMEEEGFDVNYFYLDDYGVPTYYELVFLSSDDYIQSSSDTLAAFLRASEKGFKDMQANPEEALKILLDHQNAENFPLSETVERQSMETLLPVMEEDGKPFLSQDASVWEENIDWLYEQGLTDEKLPAEEFMEVIEY